MKINLFSLLLLPSWSLMMNILCNPSWCPESSKGDGVCDPNCMVSFCNFDSNYTTNPRLNPENSDCYQLCIDNYSCLSSNLGNGICDENCNNPVCGYDLGDCGYCSSNCNFYIGYQENLDKNCFDSCDNQNCYYGLGACKDCSLGCNKEMLGDGICDSICNVLYCNYDFGDCNNNQCNPGCELWMIGDNNCNEECNNLACTWDGGDCDCSQGCHSYMKGNEICEAVCDNLACDYDGEDCQKCAPECLYSMLGDGICDSACNVSDCHYDNYDCGCAEGCDKESYGQCKDSCMNSFCQYDTNSASICQNTDQILFALHYGFIFKNLTDNISLDNCTSTNKCLSTEALDSSSCHTNCDNSNCIYSWNMCDTNVCGDSNCLSCNSNSLGDCFKCNSITYQFYGYCLTKCLGGHEAVNFLGNYLVCLIPKDYSTKANPAIYYVTSLESTDIYEGDGTFSNPFASLSLALASIYSKYAIIYLFNDGDHYFTCVNTSNPVSTILVDACDPLSKSFTIKNLLITSYDNTSITIKTKPDSNFLLFTIASSTTLTIKNIIFDGKEILSDCPSSVSPYCSYCPSATLGSDGYYYSDQGTRLTSFLNTSKCNIYHSKTLFNMQLNSNLLLESVNFTDWRMELKSIITSYGGNLILANVNFDNIRCYWASEITTQLEQSSENQGKYSVIYFLDCGDSSYICGSFEYTNGVVSRLNNGYEYESEQYSGFLSADKIRNVKLKNITFVNNILYNSNIDYTTYSLIRLAEFRSIEISHCVFDKNIANYGLIYLYPTALVFRNDVNSNDELIDLLLYHVYIHDTIFKNNFGLNVGLLSATYNSQLQRILFENLLIDGNGVFSGPLISIKNNIWADQYIADTKIAITDLNGDLVEAIFKKRDFIFKDSIITNNYWGGYGICDIYQLFNTRIKNLTVESNGVLENQNINTILWGYYVDDTNLYTKKLVDNANSIDCMWLWYAFGCYNNDISESKFIGNSCKYHSPVIYYNYDDNINFTDITFEGNSATSWDGICIKTAASKNIRIINSTFNNNINSYSQGLGALDLTANDYIYIENTIISNNIAGYNSGIYFFDGSLFLNKVTFESNLAISGPGALYFMVYLGAKTHILDIRNCVFKDNISFNAKGGAVLILGTIRSQAPAHFYAKGNLFISNTALIGSAIYIDSSVVLSNDSIIESCAFMHNNAVEKGAIANLNLHGILSISNSLFLANYAEIGSALYYTSSEESNPEESKMIINSCNFTSNSGNSVLFTDDVAIYSYIETIKCIFQNNEGPIVSLVHDYWKDDGSIIANSTITAGTVYLTSNSTADCESTSFINNTSTLYAGAIKAEGNSYFHCNDCKFYQNSAKYGGVLYFEQSSYFFIENSNFSNNSCTDKGSAIYVSASDKNSILKNSKLFNNYAESEGLIYSLISNITIDSCHIFDNTANKITPGIYLTLSNATIINSQFYDQEGIYGSFVYLASNTKLIIKNSRFKNGKAYISGGSVYALSSSLELENSIFEYSVSNTGNTVLAFSTALNISRCLFLNTYSLSSGGVISISGSEVFIEKSFFENFTDSAIDGNDIDSLKIIETSFKNSAGIKGGAISCINTHYVYIESCNFNNNTSLYGGALYFIFTSNTINSKPYEVISTTFINNTSSAGGAIYLDNINVDIKSSNFYENKAFMTTEISGTTYDSGIGGAINLGCSYPGACSFNIISNDFSENIADNEGGAIIWKEVMPKFENNSFKDNKAEYGENIASYPVTMKVLNTNWAGELNDLASGQVTTTPLIVGLIDHMGSVVTTENSYVGELISLSKDIVLSGELKVEANGGIFTFTSFVISAQPGSSFSIEIQTNGIDASKSIKANDGLAYNSSILVDVTLRNCELGEATVGINCVICAKDFYSLDPKNENCLACPDEAICYGNYTMVPKHGYWRSSMLSTKFWPCPNSNACIGSDPQNISYTGNCDKGYTGNLCQSCSEGYSKTFKNHCEKCQSLPILIIKALGIGIGFLILCWLMIWLSKNSAYKPKSLSSVYIKILINYVQLIALTTTFNLSWPSYVKQLFSVQNNTSFISDQIFSFDCLLNYNKNFMGEDVAIFYQKLFVMAILPIFIPFIAGIFWSLISLWKKSWILLKDNIVTTSIIVVFLMHPSLIKYYFSSFDCTELDNGKEWLSDDLNLRCWDNKHVLYITTISLPAILLWGIGIPTNCFHLLNKNKDKLSNINVRIRYGFLFNGYKSRSYYWEFVIIYRKIAVICCSVFLVTVSVDVQALTALFILVVFLYLQCKIKPYNGDDLNRLEAISISASAITIYFGLYYLTGTTDQITELIFFIIIISANLYFIIYWVIKAGNAYINVIIKKIPFLKKIRESLRETILSPLKDENINPKGQIFKNINMKQLFLRKLKGNNELKEENSKDNCFEENDIEKKIGDEGNIIMINIEIIGKDEEVINAEEKYYKDEKEGSAVEVKNGKEKGNIDLDKIAVLDPL